MTKILSVAILIAFGLSTQVAATPTLTLNSSEYRHPPNGICEDHTVKEEVTSTDFVWGIDKFKDNYDVAAFLTNVARKDSSKVFNPFSGTKNVTKKYEVSGTFCTPKVKKDGKETTVLLATHGLGYDRRYWASSYMPEEYSFVDYALANGYSVFYYDRLGTGKSEKQSGYENQASIQTGLIAKLTQAIRNGTYTSSIHAEKIILVGHSFGSFTSNALIAVEPDIADGAVLTGIGYANSTDLASVAIAWLPSAFASRIASTLSPHYSSLDTGYVGFGDIYAHAETFFHEPFNIPTIEYAQSISQPFAMAEFLTLGGLNLAANEFSGPVFVTTGEFDLGICGGECRSTFAAGVAKVLFPSSKALETYVHPGAGHGINYGANATGFYGEIVGFLDRNF
ncbi:alpha/beta-hydrolase [Zopfia rhizophila CBS 207.26]|uniref:Alpha/beta-hydrolase n=1 Tax=Zopfia rhizophila CBS 207.26 TaxID=1314779 RepID=A0A6A6EC18_9PEZI|nr:alpha/beta-hydrolase [Zopfia rhizophila CBS 207.26]